MRMPGCSKLTSTLSACHASGTHFIPLETETLSDLSATVEAMFEQLATVLVAKPSSFIFGKIEVQHVACGFSPSVDDIIYCLTIYFAFPFYINYSYFLHFLSPFSSLYFFMIFSAYPACQLLCLFSPSTQFTVSFSFSIVKAVVHIKNGPFQFKYTRIVSIDMKKCCHHHLQQSINCA